MTEAQAKEAVKLTERLADLRSIADLLKKTTSIRQVVEFMKWDDLRDAINPWLKNELAETEKKLKAL